MWKFEGDWIKNKGMHKKNKLRKIILLLWYAWINKVVWGKYKWTKGFKI